MSEFYNHTSGSYENYLATSAEERTAIQIRNASNKQIFANAVMTTHLSNDIDNLGKNINTRLVRMETGIRTSISQNTYATIASAAFLQQTFQNGFDSVNMTLDLGFAGVSESIGDLSAAVSHGFYMMSKQMEKIQIEICDRLDKIHDIVNNPILTKSRELYRRAFTNFSKGFHEEALEDIKQAVEINKTDYISWYLLGKIYLYGVSEFSNTLNIEEAINALSNAAKYISPDITESSDAANLASEIHYNIAFANYVLGTQKLSENSAESTEAFNKAKTSAEKSYQCSDNMLESLYIKSRCEALEDNKEGVLKIADSLIEKDCLYSLRYLADPDFSEFHKDIEDLIESKRQLLLNEFKDELEFLKTCRNDFEFSSTPTRFSESISKELEVVENLGTQYLDLACYRNNNYSYLYNMFKDEDFPCDRIVCERSVKEDANAYNASINEIAIYGLYNDNILEEGESEVGSTEKHWAEKLKFKAGLYFDGTKLKEVYEDSFINFEKPNHTSHKETEISKIPTFAKELIPKGGSDYKYEYIEGIYPETSWNRDIFDVRYTDDEGDEQWDDIYFLGSKKYPRNNRIFFRGGDMDADIDIYPSNTYWFQVNSYTVYIISGGTYPFFWILQPSIRSKKSIEEEKKQIEKFDRLQENKMDQIRQAIEENNKRNEELSKHSGCYVATAVYGSYDCPQVWTLRRFRDNTLAETWYGRLFIHTYYAISPTLVKWFGDKAWFKKMWKGKLDKMVNKLNSKGVKDTPYEDKCWR